MLAVSGIWQFLAWVVCAACPTGHSPHYEFSGRFTPCIADKDAQGGRLACILTTHTHYNEVRCSLGHSE
jgi:hypothetical protein